MAQITDPIPGIMAVIQRTYNDASQTVLDRECASAIVAHLRETGWAAPDELRAIVASAGGRIVLSDKHLIDPPDELWITSAPDRVLSTR